MTLVEKQTIQASILGTEAFKRGTPRIPALDKSLLQMLEGRKICETPKGELSSRKLMDLWLEAWDNANLSKAA